jgi:hypothetical protein
MLLDNIDVEKLSDQELRTLHTALLVRRQQVVTQIEKLKAILHGNRPVPVRARKMKRNMTTAVHSCRSRTLLK